MCSSNEERLIISYCLLLTVVLFQFCHAIDSLIAGQSIKDGQTLTSAGGNFTLGFFSPGNSQKRYVGIWFNKISVQTIVWVANSDNPLSDSSGVFKNDGNLVVLNRTGSFVWSSNASVLSGNSTAQLLDTGNMVLKDADSVKVLWESFDHPTNTFLPGMRLGLNLKTGESQLYTAWKNPNDPAPGIFSLGVDPRGSAQLFMWNGSVPYWRSGQWSGKIFTGIPDMTAGYIYGFNLISDEQEGDLYFTYSRFDSSVILRYVIDSSGQIHQYGWDQASETWDLVWAQPITDCELYNHCGAFGSCNQNGSPICNCLEGFEPRFSEDWSLGKWSGGCLRRTQLQCGKNGEADGFLKLRRMKLPNFSHWTVVSDAKECEGECAKNCSCMAFAYVNGIGCMVWDGDLVDLSQFSGGGEELYIRLAVSDLDMGGKKFIPVIIVVTIILGSIILGVCAYFLLRCRAKHRESPKTERGHEVLLFGFNHGVEVPTSISNANNLGEDVQQGKGPFRIFDFGVISSATSNFSNENKLGEGGFGPVYKGTLSEGQEIAIKRLSKSSGQGLEEFKSEVKLIAKLQHRNLVKLLGCCIQGGEKMLLYEYMPNKSLDAFLFDPNKRALLDWGKRFHIVQGVSRGLLYLHRDSTLRIIHRDLKASNILLDEEMNPKISDFGMARIFGGNQTEENTNRVVGTYGYMSPEYAMEGIFSMKSDVFSFGVLLLEIVSGRRNTSFQYCEHSLNLIGHAWQLWNENKWLELIDPSLGHSDLAHEVLNCIHVGLLCVQDDAVDRPTMPSVVFMLENETTNLPIPKQPAFSTRRSIIERDLPASNPENFTINDVTITKLRAR